MSPTLPTAQELGTKRNACVRERERGRRETEEGSAEQKPEALTLDFFVSSKDLQDEGSQSLKSHPQVGNRLA